MDTTGRKKALITGITGQDGSYLVELLLGKGYVVHGIMRRSSTFPTVRIDHIYQDPHDAGRFFLHYGDLSDSANLRKLIYKVEPDELYNLGAQSHVRTSFDIPEYTANVTGLGVLRLLEAIKDYEEHTGRRIKFYQASSSEMFGSAPPPQNEETPFQPRSPYGISKVFGFYATKNYREAYGMFACNGILFNHESERRGETFVSRKVARGVARIKAGLDGALYLGNLNARRDWGHAKDYVEAMWLILQQDEPEDFVIGTGESRTVRELVDLAFRRAGISDWEERGLVKIDPRYYRPTEVDHLRADFTKAKTKLGWEPKIEFVDLIHGMVDEELKKHGVS